MSHIKISYWTKDGSESSFTVDSNCTEINLPQDISSIDLTPISECKNLRKLEIDEIANMELLDLTPLAHCRSLRILELYNLSIRELNLGPLSNCSNLQELTFEAIYFKSLDLAPLAQCTSLRELTLSDCNLTRIDLGPLSNCRSLQTVWITSNHEIEGIDLSPLSHCINLEVLKLDHNLLDEIDLSPLSHCISLKELELNDNSLEEIDLSPLSECAFVEKLSLENNELTSIDLNPLVFCPKLKVLSLDKNEFDRIDLTPLKDCRNLEIVEASWTEELKELDLSPFSKSHWSLRSVHLSGPCLEVDFVGLKPCKNIEELSISVGRTIDLAPLNHFSRLKWLALNDLRKKYDIEEIDLTPIANSHDLRKLDIYVPVHSIDLSPLSGKKNLEIMSLRSINLREVDITPLISCENLTEFRVLTSTSEFSANAKFRNYSPPAALVDIWTKIVWYDETSLEDNTQPDEPPSHESVSYEISIQRGYEIVGGKLVYKVKIKNNTPSTITDVTVLLTSYPRNCLKLLGKETQLIQKIEPSGFVTPSFDFSPSEDCVKGTIQSLVVYNNHQHHQNTLTVESQQIRSVCDLLQPLTATVEKFVTMISQMEQSSEEQELEKNAQVLFHILESLLPTRNFHKVHSESHVVGGQFFGTMKGLARGKYTKKRVAIELSVVGGLHGHTSNVTIEASGEDDAMLPVTIYEFSQDIRNMFKLLETVKEGTDEILDRVDVLTKGTTLLLQAAGESIEEIRHVKDIVQSLNSEDLEGILLLAIQMLDEVSSGQQSLERALDEIANKMQVVSKKLGIDLSRSKRIKDALKDGLKEGAKRGIGAGIWFLVKSGFNLMGIAIP